MDQDGFPLKHAEKILSFQAVEVHLYLEYILWKCWNYAGTPSDSLEIKKITHNYNWPLIVGKPFTVYCEKIYNFAKYF